MNSIERTPMYEVGTLVSEKFDLMYCNGIEATPEAAQEQAGVISKAFNNGKVTIFHNTTKLFDYFDVSATEMERQAALASQLASEIHQRIENHSSHKVVLFAHSHGTFITRKALEMLTSEDKQHLSVYGCAGVTMIPNEMARDVHNVVFEGDMICRDGNLKFEPIGVLERVIKIQKRMILDNTDLNSAIFNQFIHEIYTELDPSSDKEDFATRQQKIQQYFDTFWSGDAEKVKGLEDRFRKYTSCFEDYQITVLPSPAVVHADLPLRGSDFAQSLKQKVSTFGIEVNNKWHIIPAFENVIQDIAKRVIHQTTL